MSTQTLYSFEKLLEQIDSRNQQITLHKDWFASDWSESIFSKLLGADVFTVSWDDDSCVAIETNAFTIQGQTDILNVLNLDVTLSILSQENTIYLTLSGVFSEDWCLGQSFTWLRKSFLSGFVLIDPSFKMVAFGNCYAP